MASKRKREQELERVGIDEPDAPRKVPKNLTSVESASDACWLVKIAPSVWKAWEGLEDGADLGSLTVSTVEKAQPGGKTKTEETMVVTHGNLETTFKGGIKSKLPQHHLSGKRDIEDALVFTTPPVGQIASSLDAVGSALQLRPSSHTEGQVAMAVYDPAVSCSGPREHVGGVCVETGDCASLVGDAAGPTAIVSTIKRQYLMEPVMGKSYDTLVKRRLVSNTIKERTTEAVAMSEVHKAARANMARKGTAFDAAFHEAQQAKLESKGEVTKGAKEKLDSKEIRSRLFGLFSKKDVYMVKELNRELQQSEKHVREVLQEIARMHTSGQHRNHWELKPEFKAGVGMPGEGKGVENLKQGAVDEQK